MGEGTPSDALGMIDSQFKSHRAAGGGLEYPVQFEYLVAMRLLGAVFAYLLIALLLGWGILLAVKGSFWLLVVSTAAYLILFTKIGCLPRAKSH
jgi:hypothetical protein